MLQKLSNIMPKALFFNIPAHGHINPTIPLVTELVQQGYEVIYFATEPFRQKIERTGATFRAYDRNLVSDNFLSGDGLQGASPTRTAIALLNKTDELMPHLIPIVQTEQPDLIIHDSMCTWGHFLAKHLGIPSVSSFALMPIVPHMMRRQWQILKQVVPLMFRDAPFIFQLTRLAQQMTQKYNIPSLKPPEVLTTPGDLSISYSVREFVPFTDNLSTNFRFVGWNITEQTSSTDFVHDGKNPLIYVSLGTLMNDNKRFFEMCIEAFTDAPYDVWMSTGNAFTADDFAPLPDNIRVLTWVPQSQVLEQASFFLTHGGMNSLHDGLYYGLPLILFPQQFEQTYNALRVADLGAGIVIQPNNISVQKIRESIDTMATQPSYTQKAHMFRDALKHAGDMTYAVQEIDALLGD